MTARQPAATTRVEPPGGTVLAPAVGSSATSRPTRPSPVSATPGQRVPRGRRRVSRRSATVVKTMLLVITVCTTMIDPRVRARTCRPRPATDARVPTHHQGRRTSALTRRGSPARYAGTVSVAYRCATLALPSSAAAASATAAAPTAELTGRVWRPGPSEPARARERAPLLGSSLRDHPRDRRLPGRLRQARPTAVAVSASGRPTRGGAAR